MARIERVNAATLSCSLFTRPGDQAPHFKSTGVSRGRLLVGTQLQKPEGGAAAVVAVGEPAAIGRKFGLFEEQAALGELGDLLEGTAASRHAADIKVVGLKINPASVGRKRNVAKAVVTGCQTLFFTSLRGASPNLGSLPGWRNRRTIGHPETRWDRTCLRPRM